MCIWIFYKSRNHLRIAGTMRAIRSKFQTEDPKRLCAAVQNVVFVQGILRNKKDTENCRGLLLCFILKFNFLKLRKNTGPKTRNPEIRARSGGLTAILLKVQVF
jgi:hypothetical protein